jgi:tetratricopeptide (TPR) repeat protein
MSPCDHRVVKVPLVAVLTLSILLLAGVPAVSRALAPGASLGSAEQSLTQGRVDETVAAARAFLQTNPQSGAAHLLLCRAYSTEEFIDQAVSECEAAAALQRDDSRTQDWMGRVYGIKADHASAFSAYSIAKKVRDAFEAAVRLNPRNGDAFDDLGSYYVQAPGIVGGGLDKAAALAGRGATLLPERARILRAGIAEKQKDYATAEREFRGAAQDSGRPDAWVDLGNYYVRRKQSDQAVAALRHAIELDKARDGSLAHAAEALMKLKAEPQMAIQALRSYLDGPSLSDSAPACKAHTDLGRLLAANGDKSAAKMEFQAALALASGYAPAKKELASL